MKKNNLFSLIVLCTLIVSACGSSPAAAPTIAPEAMQNTAVAAAFTIVAQTQAAIPTNTAIPPTETPTQTPLPTETLVVLATETPAIAPTLQVPFTPTTQAGGGDPCNTPLPASPDGNPAKIKIENQSGAPVTVSLYLNLTAFGVCGYRGYNLGKGDATTITDLPQGCYNVGVFVNDTNKPTKSFGYGCVNNPDLAVFIITRESVTLH